MRVSEVLARRQYLSVTSTLTAAAWNTVATHEVFTITGTVRMQLLPLITTSLTSGGALTAQIGIEGATTAFVGNTALAALVLNTAWLSTTPTGQYASTSLIDRVVTAGLDVGYEILTAAATAGVIVWHCWWEPLVSGSSVVAGTGAAL